MSELVDKNYKTYRVTGWFLAVTDYRVPGFSNVAAHMSDSPPMLLKLKPGVHNKNIA